MVSKVGAFLAHGGLEHQFQESQAIRYAVRMAVDRCLSKAGLIREIRTRQTVRGYGSCGDEQVSGNTMERRAEAGVDTTPTTIYKCGILLVLKRVVFLRGPLCCCTVPALLSICSRTVPLLHGRIEWYSIVVASLNPAHSSVIHSECLLRESCPRDLAHSPGYSQRALDLGRVSLMTARPLEY